MKPFTWLALPVLAISTHALVIPPSTDISHDVSTIAGSIGACSYMFDYARLTLTSSNKYHSRVKLHQKRS